MKIFVTVGTTRFDQLVQYVEHNDYFSRHECIVQVGPRGQRLEKHQYFAYADDIDQYYMWADVVVTHAGAGSIFRLLSLGTRMVIVPNTIRVDKHQADIADFMHRNHYAISVRDLSRLPEAIEEASTASFVRFDHAPFFATDDILAFIDS